MKKFLFSLSVIATAAGLAVTANAGLIFSDTFSYPNGDISMAAGTPWSVHSGTTTTANIENGQLRLTAGNAQDVNALLAGQPYTTTGTDMLYASFKLKVTSVPSILGTYFAHFKDTNSGAATGFGGRVWVSATNAVSGGTLSNKFRVGIGNGTAVNAASGQIDQTLDFNTTYVVVTRFVPATGIATIWLNPVLESDPSVTANDPGTVPRPNPIDVVAYAFRQNTGIGSLLVDDLRVGTSFADVAGANNPPSITGVASQTIAASNSTPALAFTIGDAETAAGSLSLSGSSSNPSLVPNANIVLGGSGSNRTVTVTPIAAQQGVALITLTVTDGDGASANTAFQMSVGVPTISSIANQSTPSNTVAGPIAFTVGDTETAAGDLGVTATSSNQGLVPDANISFTTNGANRTITLTPLADQAGIATITVSVSDGVSTASRSFVLTVNPLLGIQAMDDFSYPDGSIVFNSGVWISHSGATVGETLISGSRLRLTDALSEDISIELLNRPFAPSSGVILYARFTVNYTNLPSSAGDYFAHFKDDSSGFRGRVFGTRLGAGIGKYRLAIANGASSLTSSNTVFPLDLSTGNTYTVVVRHDIGGSKTTLWIDPSSESAQNVTLADNAAGVIVTTFAFRQSSGIGTLFVDDLKIGTAFSDVIAVRPALQIIHSGPDVQISWPNPSDGYVLQSTAALSAPPNQIAWADTGDEIAVQGDRKIVRRFGVTDNQFFRLIKP